MGRYASVVSPDQDAWFVVGADLLGASDPAFAWNQWEQDSLSAAEGAPEWQGSIRDFWDMHLPVLLHVKSGYADLAIRNDLTIVAGEEPEFEETVAIADNFATLLEMVATSHESLARYL